jgi:hypothetical protein
MKELPAVFAVLLFVLLAAAPASADEAAPEFTIGAGAGIADPYHGDLSFTAAAWEVSARWKGGRWVLMEAFAGEWLHDDTARNLVVPLYGPAGPIGYVAELVKETTHRMRVAGVNVLPAWTRGRVRLWGGGGGGVLLYTRRSTTSIAGCPSHSPFPCDDYETSHASGALTVQAAAGADVAIGRFLAAFAKYGVIVPLEDPGFGHGALVAGLRVGFR